MKYIYHYHGRAHLDGNTYDMDGIVDTDQPVESYSIYEEVKERILGLGEPDLSGARFTLRSLSLLSTTATE